METAPSAKTPPPGQSKSRPRRWLVFSVVFIAIVGGALYLISPNSEPKYQGIALSRWLERYHDNIDADPQREEAAEAVRHIGVNAIPLALQWLRASDSKLKSSVMDFLERRDITAFSLTSARMWQERGASVFEILGPDGAEGISGLAKLIAYTNSAARAAHILCSFDMHALPALMGGLTDRNATIRAITAREMLEYRLEKAHALPLEDMPDASLLALLRDTESSVRQLGARGIGIAAEMGKVSPTVAVHALTTLLGGSSSEEWQEAVWALGNFGSDAKEAAPVLIRILQTNASLEGPDCECALRALKFIGVADAALVPAIAGQLASHGRRSARLWAIEKLGAFGSEATVALPALRERLEDSDPPIRADAAEALKQLDPQAAVKAGVK